LADAGVKVPVHALNETVSIAHRGIVYPPALELIINGVIVRANCFQDAYIKIL